MVISPLSAGGFWQTTAGQQCQSKRSSRQKRKALGCSLPHEGRYASSLFGQTKKPLPLVLATGGCSSIPHSWALWEDMYPQITQIGQQSLRNLWTGCSNIRTAVSPP